MKSNFRDNTNRRYLASSAKGIYEVAKNVLTQRLEKERANLRGRVSGKELGRRRRFMATIGAGAIGIVAASGVNALQNKNIKEEVKEPGFNYITQYAYTNAYKEKPDNNKIDKMYEGDVIEYSPTEEGYYYQVNDSWEIGPRQNSITRTSWVKCKTVIGEEDGYVPSVYVDHYYPYKVSDTATFITEVRQGDMDSQEEERNLGRARVWVLDENLIDEENGLYSAIIRDENDQYLKGKISLDGLERDTKYKSSLGIMNSSTFIREYPLVTELDEKNIIRDEENNELVRIYNGEKVKVIEEIQDKEELWFKCEVEGHEGEIYLSSVALKPMKEFETEMDIIENDGKITSLDGTERLSLRRGDKIQVDLDSKTYNGLYSVMIDNGSVAAVGYMTAASLGLEEEKAKEAKEVKENVNLIPVTEEKQNSYKYILDFAYCDNFAGVEATVKELVDKDLLAGIVVRAGTTSRSGDNFEIYNFTDDKNEYASASEDTILLDAGYQEMQDKSSEHIIYNGKLQSIKNLERVIQLAVDCDLAFGLYYYQGSADKNRTSAEAAYMYNLDKKLKADMGEVYINAKKLPFMDDFEDAQETVDVDMPRLEQFGYKTELLGMGVEDDGFWAIDNVDPKQGYHMLDDYNNQVTFYSAILPTCNIQSKSFEEIDNRLSEKGYTVIYNSTRALDYGSIEYDDIKEMNDIKKYTLDGFDWFKDKYTNFDQALCDRSDLVQIFLDVPTLKGQSIDLSLASEKTIDEIIAGTYKHHCTYREQLEEVEKHQKYSSTNYQAAEKSKDNEILEYDEELQAEEELQSEAAIAELEENKTKRVAVITKTAELDEYDMDDR